MVGFGDGRRNGNENIGIGGSGDAGEATRFEDLRLRWPHQRTQGEMTGTTTLIGDRLRLGRLLAGWLALTCVAVPLGGCSGVSFSQVYQRGYVLPEGALEQVPMGASQEQVLIVLGTPS